MPCSRISRALSFCGLSFCQAGSVMKFVLGTTPLAMENTGSCSSNTVSGIALSDLAVLVKRYCFILDCKDYENDHSRHPRGTQDNRLGSLLGCAFALGTFGIGQCTIVHWPNLSAGYFFGIGRKRECHTRCFFNCINAHTYCN